ncbi:MAG: GNAT family N-acetyltransferase [Bacteroidota bacterium]
MTSPATIIRRARSGDLPEVVRLCAAHAAYEGAAREIEGQPDALERLLFGEAPPLACLVAERDQGLAGYATWAPQVSTWDAARYAYLDCLYLRPEARGQGLGRQLIEAVARDAHATGLRQLQWQTPVENAGAIRFYDRLGATSLRKARYTLATEAALLSHA